MLVTKDLRKKIHKKCIPLHSYNLNSLAWLKTNAIETIDSLLNDNIGILGGDVYQLNPERLIPLADNWVCAREKNEPFADFFLRSKKESRNYIENYPVHTNRYILFAITFTEETENLFSREDTAELRLSKKDTVYLTQNLSEGKSKALFLKSVLNITDNATKLRDNWLMCPLCFETWETQSNDPIIECPKCEKKLCNPKFDASN